MFVFLEKEGRNKGTKTGWNGEKRKREKKSLQILSEK